MAALTIALLDLPYGYYILLRFIVCGVSVYFAIGAVDLQKTGWAWVLGGIALLYNPLVRVHLDRSLWSVINLATIWLLAVHMWKVGRSAGSA